MQRKINPFQAIQDQGTVSIMKRILVIDDDDMLRAMFKKLLSDAGYGVAVAENGI